MGQEPFEALVAAHHAEIYRYLRRVSARTTEAEDLSQETFLRAFRAYRRLTPDANSRAWLFAIATNVYRNHVRSEVRRRAAHDAMEREAPRAQDGPEDAARQQEARMAMDAAIERLPVRQRLAFILRKVHDLSYQDIGESLGCSAETARAHVFQAYRKIRLALAGGGAAVADATERAAQAPAERVTETPE
jgi:RNA polymerase sigma-70 factor, ECF subfamily